MANPTTGANFYNEIAAAGLATLPFSWGSDGVNLSDPRLTAPQKTAINAVLAAHDPTKPDQTMIITVTSAAAPLAAGTYALDPTSQAQLAALATAAASGLGLPAGFAGYPDATGAIKTHTQQSIMDLYKAVRDYLYGVYAARAAWAQSQVQALPSNSVALAH
jgi:hypothetical protein